MSPDCEQRVLSDIIFCNGYAETKKDADTIAKVLVERQKAEGRLPSLYTLQKRLFGQVRMTWADSCDVLQAQRETSCRYLGQYDSIFPFADDTLRKGSGKITVTVYENVTSTKKIKQLLNKQDEVPCGGVKVLLKSHLRDSANQMHSPMMGYVETDSNGVAVFEGLDTRMSYSVLPIQQGFEFGSSKGTVGGKWDSDKPDGDLSYRFERKEHKIPLLGNATLAQIKADKTLLVRSPQEYKAEVVKWFVLVLLAWWILCLYLVVKKRKINGALVSSCMFLTGLCMLIMFSIQDPLNDELYGVSMGQGVVIGLALCLAFQRVDFVKFYQNKCRFGFDIPMDVFRWLFLPYRQKVAGLAATMKSGSVGFVKKSLCLVLVLLSLPFLLLDLLQVTRLSKKVDGLVEKMPKGIGWLFLALVLTFLLWTPLGQAIGGMKVNLRFFGLVFQPSEISKYLILFFIAAFFTQKADTIIAYSQPNRIKMLGSKMKTLLWILVGLGVLMALYILLGDMGPGLVLGITFILLYSLIKSKVNLDHLDEEKRWKRILSCDFAMLIYGVLTFVVFLIIGYILGNMLLFGVLWFVFWIALGYVGFRKQLFESALLMNMVIFIFIFGGQLLGTIPALRDSSVVERFDDRTKMCVNTWGDLDIAHSGRNADPVSNTQVANGLWSLASGGITGQGFGGGKPSLTPAFHTDMILSSIGEQLGWIGLLLVVLALAVLLRKMAVVGYKVGHPFAFYLCLGFAVVIGVQFFIIALGSSGMIPLTGVTVPFLSFGRVSMILNLAAFGVVLSLSGNVGEVEAAPSAIRREKSVNQYSYPISMVTAVFLFFAFSTLMVWQHYQLWKRSATLIHPAFVINTQGSPVVEYNPRIRLLMRNMYAGRIYDRNGVLLATSDKSEIESNANEYISMGIAKDDIANMCRRTQSRYYPLGMQTFFMVGDQNEGLLFSYDECHPSGYMAEVQHLSYLRGFDNVLYDDEGTPVKVQLRTRCLKENTYLAPVEAESDPIQLRDYSALVKYLKNGIDGRKLERHNNKVKDEKYDLHLTLDAALQCELQDSIAAYMQRVYRGSDNFHLMRVSAVVLDAANGDLLASANYPLPDFDRLRKETGNYYSDNLKDKNWQAYTDVDLGTIYRTMPGSTAKVMSAMAGLIQGGEKAARQTYLITAEDAIEINAAGKPIEPTGNVGMREAIVQSSNCYFVNLVNHWDLYPSLEQIYKTVGVSIGSQVPYYFTPRTDTVWKAPFEAKVSENRAVAKAKYANYCEQVKKGIHHKMDAAEWKWAWGQGWYGHELLATPLNMARVAATVVNGGKMPVTQYLLSENKYEKTLRNEGSVQLMKPGDARILYEYMKAEAANQHARQKGTVNLPSYVGGKTGTPERERVRSETKRYNKNTQREQTHRKYEKINDGWYIFFVDAPQHPIAVAVRMERGLGSGHAVRLTEKILLTVLQKHKYIAS